MEMWKENVSSKSVPLGRFFEINRVVWTRDWSSVIRLQRLKLIAFSSLRRKDNARIDPEKCGIYFSLLIFCRFALSIISNSKKQSSLKQTHSVLKSNNSWNQIRVQFFSLKKNSVVDLSRRILAHLCSFIPVIFSRNTNEWN